MRHHSVLVLTMFELALTPWPVTGFPPCKDLYSPDYCRSWSCGQPGSGDVCQKTCGLCPEDCRLGYFKDGSSCRRCEDGVDVPSVDYRRKCDVPCNHSNTWGPDCLTPCSKGCRNQTCHRWTGQCLQNCKSGYYGPKCDMHCEGCRSCVDKVETCDNEGRCLCGCKRGKRGDKCDQECPNCETCFGNDCTCQDGFRGTLCSEICENCKSCKVGNCTCKVGFHGDACTVPCPQNCSQNVCGQGGECTRGCKVGWYGRSCGKQCGNCVGDQCSLNGTCTSGCNSGWYGAKCDEACDVNCDDTLCYRNGTCERCKPGFHGDRCKTTCSTLCHNQTCDRSGTCCSCRVGNFGVMCEQHCSSNCVDHTCEQRSGACISGCATGWYGDTCDVNCPDRCASRSCHRETGSCPSCVQGFQGSHCNVSCPQYCTKCEQYGDKCLFCQQNHFGYKCEKQCSPGCKGGICNRETGGCSHGCTGTFYGHFCNYSCSDHCANRACLTGKTDLDSPTCTDGCKDGWWGDYCANTCSPHCVKCDRQHGQCLACEDTRYGENCNLTCSTSCLKSQCNLTGDCINGCESGRYGSRCSGRCPHVCNTCQHNGACVTCADGWKGEHCTEPSRPLARFLWVVIPCLLIATLIVLAAIVMRRKSPRHSWKERRRDLRGPSSASLVCILNPSYEASTNGCTTPVNLDALDYGVVPPCVDVRINDGQWCPPSHPLASGDVTDTVVIDRVWSTEVKVHDLRQYVESMKRDDSFTSQFYNLPRGQLGPCTHAELPENVSKNRYRNILPYDHSRVQLSRVPSVPGSDFINANFINGYGEPRAFVATQGPYAAVMGDFWRMIWETDASKVIMLTNLVENRKAKCEKYWPDFGDSGTSYDDVHVQCVAEEEQMDYTVRTFSVHGEGHPPRTLQHYHFTAWPDKGVPHDVRSLVEFHRLVSNSPSKCSGPKVVHCSAGIGRTGTFIALDFLLAQAREEGAVDPHECIVKLRHQRMDLIQTRDQYIFLHDALIEALPSSDRRARRNL
ncbi:multiple epidermal growth factor-like domains protein 11 isoform X2 [Haliotis asinina]|uniref:multiple epidermal growth factor-like domains protein 11 isoform X2 n=1 Tax=Haliotis asinina TaxID=109174 RepID=UPI0035318A62